MSCLVSIETGRETNGETRVSDFVSTFVSLAYTGFTFVLSFGQKKTPDAALPDAVPGVRRSRPRPVSGESRLENHQQPTNVEWQKRLLGSIFRVYKERGLPQQPHPGVGGAGGGLRSRSCCANGPGRAYSQAFARWSSQFA